MTLGEELEYLSRLTEEVQIRIILKDLFTLQARVSAFAALLMTSATIYTCGIGNVSMLPMGVLVIVVLVLYSANRYAKLRALDKVSRDVASAIPDPQLPIP